MGTKIEWIELEGYLSFAKKSRIEFPDENGLVFVQGENLEHKRIKSNGSGKSSLLGSIAWCLHGESNTGAKGPQVESWQEGAPPTRVAMGVTVGEEAHEICRTRKPITLTIDGDHASEEDVQDLVGMDLRDLMNSALIGQDVSMFTDLPAAERLDYLSSLLDLDQWTDASTDARSKVKDLEKSLATNNSSVAVITGRVEAHKETLAQALAQFEELEGKRDQEMEKMLCVRTRLGKEKYAAHCSEPKFEKKLSGFDGVWKKETKQEAVVRELKGRERIAENKMISDTLSHDQLIATKNDLEAEPEECVSCGVEVDPDYSGIPLAAVNEQIGRAKEALDLSLVALHKCQEELVEEEVRLEDRKAAVAEHVKAKLARVRQAEARDVEIEEVQQTIDHLGEALDDELVTSLEGKIKTGLVKAKKLRKASILLEENLSRDKFWVQGFKNLRLWKMDSAMAQLAVNTNGVLHDLGLAGWEVRFYSERKTKSKSVSRGFFIDVVQPGKEPCSIAVCSGGERQRLRIAVAVGLSDLVRSTMQNPPAFEVWDEPTAYIVDEGVTDLVEFFSRRAVDMPIYLVEHRVLDSGAFSRTIQVVKDNEGSRVAWA